MTQKVVAGNIISRFRLSFVSIQYAEKRGRGDMVNIYTRQLTEIVKNISYENVINKIKNR